MRIASLYSHLLWAYKIMLRVGRHGVTQLSRDDKLSDTTLYIDIVVRKVVSLCVYYKTEINMKKDINGRGRVYIWVEYARLVLEYEWSVQ